jgi:hypothetical protein
MGSDLNTQIKRMNKLILTGLMACSVLVNAAEPVDIGKQ